jgi:hypothetical protein
MAVGKDDMLLEEWKQNVALYIDQDKRGLERTKMFLTLHAGLFVFYGLIFTRSLNLWSVLAAYLIAGAGIFLTVTSYLMSKRAHAFIHLRRIQALMIEDKLNKMVAGGSVTTTDGAISTFTREIVSFQGETVCKESFGGTNAIKWQQLIDELKGLGSYISNSLLNLKEWKYTTIKHFLWLKILHITLIVFWILITVIITVAWLCGLFCDIVRLH